MVPSIDSTEIINRYKWKTEQTINEQSLWIIIIIIAVKSSGNILTRNNHQFSNLQNRIFKIDELCNQAQISHPFDYQ